jgi:hypothetical protein
LTRGSSEVTSNLVEKENAEAVTLLGHAWPESRFLGWSRKEEGNG